MMGKKKRAIERAAECKDSNRLLSDNIPLIQDENVFVTAEIAENMLKHNNNNRIINWRAVEKIKDEMIAGKWVFHAQGIILDNKGNILTGQKRLWAVVLSNKPQWFRVSRGTPSSAASAIDRGQSQTSRDLASRHTKRKHSPVEKKLAKFILAIRRVEKPSLDEIANVIKSYDGEFKIAIKATRGTKKDNGVLMIMAAICYLNNEAYIKPEMFALVLEWAANLENEAFPIRLQDCWRRPAANFMVMEKAVNLCSKRIQKQSKDEDDKD